MANRELNVVLGLKLGEFQAGLMKAEKQLKRFGDNMARTGRELTQSLTLPILGVGAGAIKAFTDIERLEKGLAAVMGSSEAAAIELRNLQEVAKLPGLGFEEAVQGSIRLQAVGLSANEARETLSAFGAAIAATGGTAQNLESVQYQLTQMISKNRILQEDFGIIQENVPLVGKAIEAAFGTRNVEQIRATGISAQEFNRRIVEALRTLPETQAAVGGLGNAFENFGDSIKVSFAELGRSINTALNLEGVLDGLANAVQNVVDYFKSLSPETQRFIVISAAVVAAIGPMMFIFGQLISLGSKLAVVIRGIGVAFTVMTGPIGLTIAAIAAVALAAIQAYKQFEGFRKVINGLIDTWLEFIKIFAEGAKSAFTGISKILKGDIIDGFKDLGNAFIKTNPIGAWATQGKRLAGAFADGYADETNRLEGVFSKLKNFAQGKGITDVQNTDNKLDLTDEKIISPDNNIVKRIAQKPVPLIDTENLLAAIPLVKSIKDTNKEIVESMKESNAVLSERAEAEFDKEVANQTERMSKALSFIQSTISPVLDSVFTAIEKGGNVFKAITQSVKQLVIQLIKAVAQAAILSLVMNLLFPGGGAAINAAKGSFGFGNILKGVLGFANGGLVTGPTLGLIGEGSGTSMSNPEVVAPLDKLRSILDSSMGGGQFVASTRLQGSDLLLVVERAERNRGR